MANKNLGDAKKAKNDEFYTQLNDIQKEMNAYIEYNPDVFRDKTILLPCDDPEWSNFTKFFAQNFETFGMKKLISTSYAVESKNFKTDYQPTLFEELNEKYDAEKTRIKGKIFTLDRDTNGDKKIDLDDLQWEYLEGDGDFRSDEVKKLRDEADIIITNPPFSLFREFMAWLGADASSVRSKDEKPPKKFAVIGNKNAITYKEIFPLIKENKIWTGYTPMSVDLLFEVPNEVRLIDNKNEGSGYRIIDGKPFARSQSIWFTNLEHGRRHQPLSLMTMEQNIRYSKHKEVRGIGYLKYDNYDAIEVPFTDAIPSDYKEGMAVPISFLDKYCPEQFEIMNANNIRTNKNIPIKQHGLIKDKEATITEPLDKEKQNEIILNRTEQNRTEQNRTEQNRTEQNRTEQNTNNLRANCHQTQAVAELWECQSASSTSIAQSNLKSLEQQKAKVSDSLADCGTAQAESHNHLSMANANTNGYSSNLKCSGIMGVPISFLDKYCPEQFEIIGVANHGRDNIYDLFTPTINGKLVFKRILIRFRK